MNPPHAPYNAKEGRLVRYLMVVSLVATLLALVLPPITDLERGGRRPQTLNNLRNVAIAAQCYATKFDGWLPAGGSRDDLLPEWSWQTQLLPYLEQDALYRRIDFARPWNSPENAELFSWSLPVFCSVEAKDRRPVNGFAVTHFTANSRLLRPRDGLRLDDLARLDGTNATILMGEIGSGFPPWAQPGNTRDPARRLTGGPGQFGNARGTECAILFAGGNGRHVRSDLSPRVLELLAGPDNGVPDEEEF